MAEEEEEEEVGEVVEVTGEVVEVEEEGEEVVIMIRSQSGHKQTGIRKTLRIESDDDH